MARIGLAVPLLAGSMFISGCSAPDGRATAMPADAPEVFCETYGIIYEGGPPERLGDYLLVTGEPAGSRDPCDGDDLAHYGDELPPGIDGVLFDDCVISWVSGGRSTAESVGIDCTPVTPPAPTPVLPPQPERAID